MRRPETMKINHEETKNTKISYVLPLRTSFLRGYFPRSLHVAKLRAETTMK
jgi:hypothetical protein